MPDRRRPVRQYAALIVIFAAAVTYQVRASLGQSVPEVDVPFSLQLGTRAVDNVPRESAAAGLRRGDEILALNGEAYRGWSSFSRASRGAKPGDPLRVRIRRDGAERELVLRWPSGGVLIPTFQRRLIVVSLLYVLPWFCLMLGFWVAAVRPRDPQAWILLLLMIAFPHLAVADIRYWEDGIRQFGIVYQTLIRSLLPVAMLLFGLYFVVRFPLDARWPWAKWILLAPSLFFAVLNPIVVLQNSESYTTGAAVDIFLRTRAVQGVLMFVSIGLFFAMTGWKMGVTPPGDARRRLRLLLWGTQLAMAPMFLLILVALTNRGRDFFDVIPAWALTIALMMLLLFPLTMAYVIVVHRALDVRVVVRQGIQYALARGGARVLMVGAAALVLFTSVLMATETPVNRPRQVTTIAIGVALMFLVVRMGQGLARWIDRRFFREAYDAERILTELSEEVRTIVDTPKLVETVARRISDSLYVPRVAFLLADGGFYRPAYAHGYGVAPDVALPAGSATVRHLAATNQPERVYLDDEESWVHRDDRVTRDERAQLERLGTQLVLPLRVKDELLGFVSLGPKKSEEPYSGLDVRLLRSVASQTGLALENSRLAAAVAAEAAQRERINREIEIAREVQERLFPQHMPKAEGFDFAGYCRPALGVGGDYYDFIGLPDGRMGIAIGDVSGKGIAAALLMASLQASVRGQTLHPEQVAAIIALVNKLIYETSASSRYATLFYAQLDTASRTLVYVNAGHNPPMLLRRKGEGIELLRLTTGGTVVGLLPKFPYEQESVQLERGDLLVCFTDGISEAMNSADEEWGEEKLAETASACLELSPQETIARLMAGADAFTAGAKQHDDMTLVVLRVL